TLDRDDPQIAFLIRLTARYRQAAVGLRNAYTGRSSLKFGCDSYVERSFDLIGFKAFSNGVAVRTGYGLQHASCLERTSRPIRRQCEDHHGAAQRMLVLIIHLHDHLAGSSFLNIVYGAFTLDRDDPQIAFLIRLTGRYRQAAVGLRNAYTGRSCLKFGCDAYVERSFDLNGFKASSNCAAVRTGYGLQQASCLERTSRPIRRQCEDHHGAAQRMLVLIIHLHDHLAGSSFLNIVYGAFTLDRDDPQIAFLIRLTARYRQAAVGLRNAYTGRSCLKFGCDAYVERSFDLNGFKASSNC